MCVPNLSLTFPFTVCLSLYLEGACVPHFFMKIKMSDLIFFFFYRVCNDHVFSTYRVWWWWVQRWILPSAGCLKLRLCCSSMQRPSTRASRLLCTLAMWDRPPPWKLCMARLVHPLSYNCSCLKVISRCVTFSRLFHSSWIWFTLKAVSLFILYLWCIAVPQEELRTGEKAVVLFKFIKHPEYLKVGAKVLFREGVTKGIGHVTKLQPIAQYRSSQSEDDEA